VTERRYSDEEVKRILDAAAESEVSRGVGPGGESGMTLAEIQRIAAEAGFSATSVRAAAVALDHVPPPSVNTRVLGLRVGVGHTAVLPRDMTDMEWRRLVAYLRDTFEAQGRETEDAGRREWRNGNLRIAIESVGGTALLTMRTVKGGARSSIATGMALTVGSLFVGAVTAIPQGDSGGIATVLGLALTGAAMTVMGAVQLPSWSSARTKQFQAIAEYARQLSAGDEP
jgi:hypothetical protein